MSKKQLTLSQEAQVLFWLENHRGKQMKGDGRKLMYDIYRFWKQDRDEKVCGCLDRDTHRKVEGFINDIEWSEETKTSPKMQQVLPSAYVEPTYTEEETSTQPIDMSEVLQAMNTTEPVLKKPTKRRTRKKKE